MATRRKKRTTSAARRRESEPVIVYIHGIGEHPPADDFKKAWDLALFGRDMEKRTRMAYWSDILHPPVSERTRLRALARESETPLEAASLLANAGLDPEDERALMFVEQLAASLAGPGAARPPRGAFGAKVLPLPGFLRRPIAEALLRLFVKDTARYFFDRDVRRRIKARLIAQIPSGGEPFILVSHSQGTVAAFEVLSESHARPEVTQFATMGSPLGLTEVQDLIEDDGFELIVPDGVRAWHNFADRLDPVALDATLASDYRKRGRIEIRDYRVINERTKALLKFNPHSSLGYLANQTVRGSVHEAFRYDSGGRFLVARDVAEGFVAPETRQSVLIEVLHPGYWALGETAEQLQQREQQQPQQLKQLGARITALSDSLKAGLDDAAEVQALRKYVSARLTANEITDLALRHRELNVYAVWRSASKSKLISRSPASIKVDAARASYAAEGVGVTWAVLDTGVQFDHPHFNPADGRPVIIDVLDCTTNDPNPVRIVDPTRADPDGHGTHVCGIIAGESADHEQSALRGIAPRSRLLVYKVLDDDGFGEDAWIIKALDDIYYRNSTGAGLAIDGVNLSLGGPFDASVYGCGYSPICKDLRDLWRQGVVVCVAAGNEGQVQVLTQDGELDLNTQLSIGDPANLDDCIAVGSVNADKPYLYGVSYFSSRGPTADGRCKPDVVAPGERITSANAAFRRRGRGFRDLYRPDSGTSMACPHVSGLIAAFLSVRGEFKGRPDEVKRVVLENCNDIGRDRYHQGAGIPNLMKMLLNT